MPNCRSVVWCAVKSTARNCATAGISPARPVYGITRRGRGVSSNPESKETNTPPTD